MSWQPILGHEAVSQGFDRVIRRGRLAHAYLFVGPAGIGKRLFALELAKALLCATPSSKLVACDSCVDCKQVDAGSHPDLHITGRPEDSLEFPIEKMQELCRFFHLKSARGRGKVAILDDADDLNEESANCFLKTLEEPPARSVLILIGSSTERQLPTIVSRCQVVRFAPLRLDQVSEVLGRLGQDDAKQSRRLARLSGGSPGLALELADPALWEFRRAFFAGLTAASVDSVALAKQWQEFVEEAGKEAGPKRKRAAQVLRLLIQMVQDALALGLQAEPRETDPEEQQNLSRLARRLSTEDLLTLQERCLEADAQIDRRVQLDLVLEALTDAWSKRVMLAAEGAT
jgi:DNA polymerase-3 subunit delta'